ncbi:MAG: bifunctional UDP-3-O-[3-hydroxymyristoyl] N-acetylglucosamine deacetylase/3-hydroxyacyl-ACP dehydratase [Saprospiraceae bacterium]
MKQRTILQSVSVYGVGLHTGKEVCLTLLPSAANTGFRFQRSDLDSKPIFSADASKVVSTNRGTTLREGEAQISTVEHVLSALVGLGVDNVIISVDGPETPIMDGSALAFVEAIEKAGIVEQDADRDYLVITEPISVKDELTGSELVAIPSDQFEVTTLIDFNSPVLGQQYASLDHLQDYRKEIASCRTFVFVHELEYLLAQNLIKGGDLNNAIVIADKPLAAEELDNLARKLDKPHIKVDKRGILNTVDLLFQNEPARHKLLDVIGDLALVGKPIKGKIVATKPGHKINVQFAALLRKKMREQAKLKGVPSYDPDLAPVYSTQDILNTLPHRYPFLMVDKIIELAGNVVVGIKNITFNEAMFQGHFPGNPIFPGVLQVEALAQTGGILALSTVADPENWDTYFLKIDNCRFKHKVIPGDTLVLKMELLDPIKRGICHMQGTAYVGNKLVSEAEMTAQIIRRTDV